MQALASLPGWNLLEPFLMVMELEDARILIQELGKVSMWKKTASAAKVLYPVALLAGVWAMISFFEACVLPMMADFLEGDMLPVLMKGLRLAFTLILAVLAAGAVVLSAGMDGSCTAAVFLKPESVRQGHSLYLACCLKALLEREVSTEALFSVLEAMPGTKVFRCQVQALKQGVMQGNGWSRALAAVPWIDRLLVQHMETGLQTGDPCGLLEVYIRQSQQIRKVRMDRLVKTLTLGAYLSVGILAVLVYQVLLAPMNMLSSI